MHKKNINNSKSIKKSSKVNFRKADRLIRRTYMKLSDWKKIRTGKREYAGANLSGADLSGANLSGAKLEHYYISGGSRNDSALFVPSLKKIWAGCFMGSALQFYRACKSKNSPEHRLYINTLKVILHHISRKNLPKKAG